MKRYGHFWTHDKVMWLKEMYEKHKGYRRKMAEEMQLDESAVNRAISNYKEQIGFKYKTRQTQFNGTRVKNPNGGENASS